jgi:mycoredoxin
MYGADWCGDCIRAKSVFNKYGIDYTYINIDSDEKAIEYVEKVNNGMHSIPVICMPDGAILVEPGIDELTRALGL